MAHPLAHHNSDLAVHTLLFCVKFPVPCSELIKFIYRITGPWVPSSPMQDTREVISPSADPSEAAGCCALCSCTERLGASISSGLAEPGSGAGSTGRRAPRLPRAQQTCDTNRHSQVLCHHLTLMCASCFRIVVQAFNTMIHSKN